jgi:hypothetical protein
LQINNDTNQEVMNKDKNKNSSTEAYIPGVCNINKEEIAYRKKVGAYGKVISLVLATMLVLLDASHILRVLLFFPFVISALGFLQAQEKFCVNYGANGKQNAKDGGKITKIKDSLSLKKDKKKTQEIYIKAITISALSTAIVIII